MTLITVFGPAAVVVRVGAVTLGLAFSALACAAPAAPRQQQVPAAIAAGEDGRVTPAAATGAPTVAAAGDISTRLIRNQQSTSDLVLKLAPTRVLALGDEQYPSGGLSDFRSYYDPTWGRFKAVTSPAPGNHEYQTFGAAGYFTYFGTLAGPASRGYYSFDLGGWHLVSLNSNIARGAGSPQETWLRADLAATRQRCILAYWHHPRFSSGTRHGSDASVATFWNDLYAERADVVLNGHEHNYERFGQQTPAGGADGGGIREFVVGTGGSGAGYPFGTAKPNSQRRITGQLGVLHLTLRPGSYEWSFVTVGGSVLDRGGPQACH